MELVYGKDGCEHSWQDDFPETIRCGNVRGSGLPCEGEPRITLVYHENGPEDRNIYRMRGDTDNTWLHDACSVAIYFCPECLNAKVLWNQA